jgi:hypothetical protein
MLNRGSLLLVSLFLLALLGGVETKQHTIHFSVPTFRRHESWAYVDRIHIDPGQMNLRSTVKFYSTTFKQGADYELELVAIPESIW